MVQQRRSNLFQLTGGLGCKFKFVINDKDSTNPLFGHIRAPRIRTPEEKGATETSLCGERHPLHLNFTHRAASSRSSRVPTQAGPFVYAECGLALHPAR